nr:unnamed protein product [Callosobruchus analis]
MLSRSVPVLDLVEQADVIVNVDNDKWYQKMLGKVRRYPLKYGNWRESEGKLWKHVAPAYPGLVDSRDSWRLVVPKKDRREIIAAAHEPPKAGHAGIFKTYSRISEKCFWPKMRSDITKFVRRCHDCAAHKVSQDRATDKMVSHPKVDRPWEMITTDLVGPPPRSKHRNNFILAVVDYLSKFTLLFPLRKATGDAIVNKIENEVFLVFGVPRIIVCDNGPQYRSRQFLKLAESYKCEVKFTANYHPRANPTEWTNRTYKTMIAMYVSDNHRTWDENLYKIGCALGTSTHETTRLTPYFVNFDRNMMLSGDDYKVGPLLDVEDGTQLGENKIFSDVRRRLEIAGKKSCDRYNLRRRHVEYLPN